MNFKVSVIIPIYNAEKSLERTINSIITQSIGFENIELILVDDCSSDNSKSIINKYSQEYDNVKAIFLEKNSGNASTPRNIGIKNSASEYIMFIDSDDEYEHDLCEKFHDCISSEDVDLVSCNFITKDHISTSKTKFDFEFENPIEKEDLLIVTSDNLIEFDNVFVWNKIFKKSIITDNEICFKEIISEDFTFCIEYLLNCNKRAYLKDYYGYNKFSQENSLSIDKISIDSVYDHITVDYMIADLIKGKIKNPDKVKKINNNIFKTPIVWVLEELITLNDNDEIKKGLKRLYAFEKDIKFESELENPLLNRINKLVLKEKWSLILITFKTMNTFINSDISRKIYRKISN